MKIKNGTIVQPVPDEETFALCEKNWRLKIPHDYRSFLSSYNAVIPEPGVFIHDDFEYLIDRFLGLIKDRASNHLGVYDIRVVETQIGERLTSNEDLVGMDMVPIAALFAGDFLCLDFRETPDAPTVCIWFHEESGDFDPVTETIANSFTEFLAMLSE